MTIVLEEICTFIVELARPQEIREIAGAARRIIPIVGGTVVGARLSGKILNVGADWQSMEGDRLAHLDARYAVETNDGALIEVSSQGLRHMSTDVARRIASGEAVDPGSYYMRTLIRLQCGDPRYGWVNESLFLATGGKSGTTVRLAVYRVG
jgi:hypothetical protein